MIVVVSATDASELNGGFDEVVEAVAAAAVVPLELLDLVKFKGFPVPAVVDVVLGSGTGPMLSSNSPNSFHSSTSSRSCIENQPNSLIKAECPTINQI